MKIVQTIIAFMVFAMCASNVFGQELLLGSDGSMKVEVEYVATGVQVSPEAQEYPAAVVEAHGSPGDPVIVSWETTFDRLDFFHLTKTVSEESAVMYYPETEVIVMVSSAKIVSTDIILDKFNVWMIISSVLMLSSWILFFKEDTVTAMILSLLAAILVLGALIDVPGRTSIHIPAIIAGLIALVVCMANFHKDSDKWMYIIYFIFVGVSIPLHYLFF